MRLWFYYTDKQTEIGSTSILIYSSVIKVSNEYCSKFTWSVFQFISEGQDAISNYSYITFIANKTDLLFFYFLKALSGGFDDWEHCSKKTCNFTSKYTFLISQKSYWKKTQQTKQTEEGAMRLSCPLSLSSTPFNKKTDRLGSLHLLAAHFFHLFCQQ